jgi:hypothetical protein
VDPGIEHIRPALPEEWDSVWRRCAYATYFHSREWAETWSRYKQGAVQPHPLSVLFTDGKEALLPLSRVMSGDSVWGFMSSPDGTYGGWISADPIGRAHATLLKEFLTKGLGHLFWYINPYDDLVAATGVEANFDDETHVIDLQMGFDAVYRDWSHACQGNERKARKSGIRVKRAETEEEWREYYQAYEDSIRRWGDRALSRYGWKLFQEMSGRRSDHVTLWLAMTGDGRIAAGALMVYAKTHAMPYHSAALEAFFALRPMNLLFSEIIRDACEGGYRWFDFGPSAGLEGVRKFKEGFGARLLGCSYVLVGQPAPATFPTDR